MPSEEPEKGDKVSWNWGNGAPGGTVAETKHEGEVAITSKRGNKIKKNAEPDNPAVHVERSGNDVVKKASELNVEKKAGGDSKNGDKRKHDGNDDEDDDNDGLEENDQGKTIKAKGGDNKKQKKDDDPKPEKRKAGRPKKAEGAPAKSKRQPTPRSTDGIGSRTRSQRK